MGVFKTKYHYADFVHFGELNVDDIFILSPDNHIDLYTKSYLVTSCNALNHTTGKAEYVDDNTLVIKIGEEDID